MGILHMGEHRRCIEITIHRNTLQSFIVVTPVVARGTRVLGANDWDQVGAHLIAGFQMAGKILNLVYTSISFGDVRASWIALDSLLMP